MNVFNEATISGRHTLEVMVSGQKRLTEVGFEPTPFRTRYGVDCLILAP